MKLSPIHRRDFIKRMRALGWEGPFPGGRHLYMSKGAHNVHIPNFHGSGEISVPLLREILRQAGISVAEWVSLR
jgi:predicted RNA binding protein YcfA (HicA-like mRNA interferase family)